MLVIVYDDLLDFYFEARKILKSKNFAATLALSAIKRRLSDIVSSFSKHTEDLLRNITMETNIILSQMLDSQLDDTGNVALLVKTRH